MFLTVWLSTRQKKKHLKDLLKTVVQIRRCHLKKPLMTS
jgi:hypothetical protein